MKKENALVFSLNKFSPTFSRGVGFGGVRLLSKPCWGQHVTRYSMLFGPPQKKTHQERERKGEQLHLPHHWLLHWEVGAPGP